jgi:nucleoid DNA-binding protein
VTSNVRPAEPAGGKVKDTAFLDRIAERRDLPYDLVLEVYEALLEGIVESASNDETIVFTGFGRFYRQQHKGHKVRFGASRVDDYSVLKFSASRPLNKSLDKIIAEAKVEEVALETAA